MNGLRRTAFTLLEVLVGLFLAGLVVAGLTMAVDLHVRVVDVSRTEIEQTQLTRALLAQIAADLRNTGQPKPSTLNFSNYKFPTLAARTIGVNGPSTPPVNNPSDQASGDSSTTGSASQSTQDYTGDLLTLTEMPPKPGVYGNMNQIMIDTNRLPRPDQFQEMLQATADAPLATPLTNTKNIVYYLGAGGATGGGTGLMRRNWDRPTASYASQQGQASDAEGEGTLLAAEVVGLEFHYFDGTTWTDTWDTNQRQAIPMAVQIILAVAKAGTTPTALSGSLLSQTGGDDNVRIHQLIVALPTGQPSTDQSTGTTTTTTDTTTQDSSMQQ